MVIGDLPSLSSNFVLPLAPEGFIKSPGLCLRINLLLRRWQEGDIILCNCDMLLRTVFLPYLFRYHCLEKMNIKITLLLNVLIVNINAKRLYVLRWNQSTLCQTFIS